MKNCISVVRQNYLRSLQEQLVLKNSLDLYCSAKEFELKEEGLLKETPIIPEPGLPELTVGTAITSGSRTGSDAANARAIHTCLPRLSRLAASDHRLWVYLTHGPYFMYCRNRWPLPNDDDKKVIHIREHWFFSRGGLRRNAISRLWWAAALTHAPWEIIPELLFLKTDDPYHYTDVLLSNQDLFQQLIERRFGNDPKVRLCVLSCVDTCGFGDHSLSEVAPILMRNLNLLASHTDLGAIPPEDLCGLVSEIIGNICEHN